MTTIITADHYSATTQAVSDAIDLSIAQDETVTVECLSEDRHSFVVASLNEACEGSEDDAEFWGADCDRGAWRVRVKGPR